MAFAEPISGAASGGRFSGGAYRRIELIQRFGILAIFLLLCVTAAVSSPYFLTAENLLNVVRQVSVVGLTSLGMTFVILTAGIDLSVGSILALTTLAIAGLKPYGPVASLLGGLAIALICGWVNGVVTTKGRIQPFIVTLGMMTALVGVGLAYSDGQPVIGVPLSLAWIGRGKLAGVPVRHCSSLSWRLPQRWSCKGRAMEGMCTRWVAMPKRRACPACRSTDPRDRLLPLGDSSPVSAVS